MVLDIHSHIIPYVDDGCHNIEDSIALIKKSYEDGVTDIIATPHHIHHRYEASKEEILTNFNLLKEKLKELNIPVNIYLGEEIHYSHEDITKLLNDKELFSLNDSKVILLEFSYTNAPHDLFETLYNIKVDGYKVIIAHVERYKWMNINIIKELKQEKDIYIQVNADAVIGKDGLRIKWYVNKLLKNNLVDYIASDMHYFRPSNLIKALDKVKDKERINKNIFGI